MYVFISCRQQFFINVKSDILNGKYEIHTGVLPRLYALIAQVEAGCFKENHISYNPSRVSNWTPEFRDQVILEHCKLKEMSAEVAKFFCLKEVAELDEYGMEYCTVRTEDNNSSVSFGIGIDCLQIEHSDTIQRYFITFFFQYLVIFCMPKFLCHPLTFLTIYIFLF